jgi:hypothetical protein
VKRLVAFPLLLSLPLFILMAGTTGKISGIVTDAQNGEPLVGANIVIVGTSLGAVTDIEGNYVITSVPPGDYSVRASMLGYAALVQTQVHVNIDLTTEINFAVTQEIIKGEEVVIVAQRPIVLKDVATSVANISAKEIASLPVTSISAVVGLQAGITGGLVVRGGGADQTAFMVDGLTLRNERDNSPYSNISLSSVQDIQVQTGGFNAEYGNIRSGIVNVVTKEGNLNTYTVSATFRISPPAAKNFGPSVYDPNNYFIRSRVDPAVAWTGTNNGVWDIYTQRQYATFDGWNAISQATLKDADPTNDLTPEAAQQLFLFQFRRQGEIVKPDYDIDAGFGGPVPFVSSELGNLRFFASYRQLKSMYFIPLSEDSYQDYNGQIRVTSDIGSGMKLMLQGMIGRQTGTNSSNAGSPGLFTTTSGIASVLDRVSYIDRRIYSPDYFAPSTISMNNFGGKFTHVLSPTTFYEASLQRQAYKYETNPGAARDLTRKYLFGNSYYADEFPYGFAESTAGWVYFSNGVGFSNSRDSSKLATYSFKFDFNSQIDKYNQIKSGAEVIYTESDVNYGLKDYFTGNFTQSKWSTTPIRLSLYAQDKFEYEGMIANLGLRFDYSHPGGDWYDIQPFDPKLGLAQSGSTKLEEVVAKVPIKKIFNISPRLGIAFPVTEYSKLFFNYGHFRSMPTPENLFLVRVDPRFGTVSYMANPNNPLPKTIAYELGYEHSLFEQYLIRVAGYYKNVSDQSTTIEYADKKGNIYDMSVPNSYEDIRGFEVTVSRNRGNWITGFANYTYMVSSSGRFGYSEQNQDQNQQKIYERTNKVSDLYQTRPIPRPYARISVDFFTPVEYGPEYSGVGVLNDWRLNFTGNWQSGSYFTWYGGGSAPADVRYNEQWKDTYGMDMRLSKNFKFGSSVNVQLFVDISNVFNIKNFSGYGFYDANDFNYYMKSLHLSSTLYNDRSVYINVPGDDKPGEMRKDGVPFTPIEPVASVGGLISSEIHSSAIYWEKNTGKYLQYNGSVWSEVSSSRMDQILKDKSYIDMPNLSALAFLNPRDIFWGLKVNFEF